MTKIKECSTCGMPNIEHDDIWDCIDFDEMRRGVEPHTTLKNWIRNLQKRWKEEKENPKVSDFAKWNRSIPTSQ